MTLSRRAAAQLDSESARELREIGVGRQDRLAPPFGGGTDEEVGVRALHAARPTQC
jgi:hypothetical protein